MPRHFSVTVSEAEAETDVPKKVEESGDNLKCNSFDKERSLS